MSKCHVSLSHDTPLLYWYLPVASGPLARGRVRMRVPASGLSLGYLDPPRVYLTLVSDTCELLMRAKRRLLRRGHAFIGVFMGVA